MEEQHTLLQHTSTIHCFLRIKSYRLYYDTDCFRCCEVWSINTNCCKSTNNIILLISSEMLLSLNDRSSIPTTCSHTHSPLTHTSTLLSSDVDPFISRTVSLVHSYMAINNSSCSYPLMSTSLHMYVASALLHQR